MWSIPDPKCRRNRMCMMGCPNLAGIDSDVSCGGTSIVVEVIYSFPLVKSTPLISPRVPGAVAETPVSCPKGS